MNQNLNRWTDEAADTLKRAHYDENNLCTNVQYRTHGGEWTSISKPGWDFERFEYRIKPQRIPCLRGNCTLEATHTIANGNTPDNTSTFCIDHLANIIQETGDIAKWDTWIIKLIKETI